MKKTNKRHYPTVIRPRRVMYPARQRQKSYLPAANPFGRNISNKSHLHTRGHDVAAYIKRTITIRDSHGNVKTAKETQFFTSKKDLGSLFIKDDD